MNKVVLIGRLARDPDIRTAQNGTQVARYTLAVDRRGKKGEAEFISCIAFQKGAEFAEKYLRKGMKIAIAGHIQTGSYTNKDGQKVYTTDVVLDDQEFVEKKEDSAPAKQIDNDGFMSIPGIDDEGLPFT